MNGKQRLERCPQEVKDIIVKNFNSLDDFYGYVYQLSINQFTNFKATKQFDSAQFDHLKAFLENEGIDFMQADDIVDEISSDYSETIAINYVQQLLGPNWKEKIEDFEKKLNDF